MRRDRRGASAGFTLIEMLAVVLIIGVLAGVLLTQLGGASDSVSVSNTRILLTRLRAAIEEYERDFGDYPPSSFTPDQGVPNDGTNVGIEALVVALYSNGRDANLGEDVFGNTDGDSAPTKLTDFETRELLEIVDDWGNPIAYIHHRDYGAAERAYVTFDPGTAEEIVSVPRAYRNPTTGRYARNRSFQLVSAGKDGRFGTDRDVTLFERRD